MAAGCAQYWREATAFHLEKKLQIYASWKGHLGELTGRVDGDARLSGNTDKTGK